MLSFFGKNTICFGFSCLTFGWNIHWSGNFYVVLLFRLSPVLKSIYAPSFWMNVTYLSFLETLCFEIVVLEHGPAVECVIDKTSRTFVFIPAFLILLFFFWQPANWDSWVSICLWFKHKWNVFFFLIHEISLIVICFLCS